MINSISKCLKIKCVIITHARAEHSTSSRYGSTKSKRFHRRGKWDRSNYRLPNNGKVFIHLHGIVCVKHNSSTLVLVVFKSGVHLYRLCCWTKYVHVLLTELILFHWVFVKGKYEQKSWFLGTVCAYLIHTTGWQHQKCKKKNCPISQLLVLEDFPIISA